LPIPPRARGHRGYHERHDGPRIVIVPTATLAGTAEPGAEPRGEAGREHGSEEVRVGVMDRFERRLDRLVSGAFARAFKSEVQPVEVAAALQRECDDRAAIVTRGRTMVPNGFSVELGGHDFDRLSMYAEPLGSELAAMVREHAEEQGYQFVGPVSVRFG